MEFAHQGGRHVAELGVELVMRAIQVAADDEGGGIPALLRRLSEIGVEFRDLETSASTLEEIFVDLIRPAA